MLFPEFVVELFQSQMASLSVERYSCPIAVSENLLRKADIAPALIQHPACARSSHHVSSTKGKTGRFECSVIGGLNGSVLQRLSSPVEHQRPRM